MRAARLGVGEGVHVRIVCGEKLSCVNKTSGMKVRTGVRMLAVLLRYREARSICVLALVTGVLRRQVVGRVAARAL